VKLRQESIICPGCACLCDDLDLVREEDWTLAVHNVCTWGASKFLGEKKLRRNKERRRLTEPYLVRRGRREAVPYERAMEEAAAILTTARRPVVYGLGSCGSLAQEAALVLAKSLRARLEPVDLAFMAPYFQALRQYGLFWAPLEVIRDEADTVVYWGANPLHSCPRHLVRYAVFARGRFTERGLEDRQVAAVDIYRTEMAKFCHLFLQVEPGREASLVAAVTALVSGDLKPQSAPPGSDKLAAFLRQGAYGVMFLGRGVGYAKPSLFDRLAQLAAVLNRRAPFILFPLSGEFNAGGLYHMLLTHLGSPFAPDFTDPAKPQFQESPVDFQEVDALLVTGADLFWSLSEDQVQELRRRQVPIVALSPFADRTTAQARVCLPVALDGIETQEIAYRMDGLPVTLGAVAPAAAPPARQVLTDLNLFL
jgi:formylmethanofuran dehydrogenase subunit B